MQASPPPQSPNRGHPGLSCCVCFSLFCVCAFGFSFFLCFVVACLAAVLPLTKGRGDFASFARSWFLSVVAGKKEIKTKGKSLKNERCSPLSLPSAVAPPGSHCSTWPCFSLRGVCAARLVLRRPTFQLSRRKGNPKEKQNAIRNVKKKAEILSPEPLP